MDLSDECDLNSQFPFRVAVIRSIINAVGHTNWPLVHVHGVSGTGKTAVTRAVLERLSGVHCAWISCLEIFNEKLLYRAILNSLRQTKTNDDGVDDDEEEEDEDPDDLSFSSRQEFLESLNAVVKHWRPEEKCVICLDNADALLQVDVTLISLLCKLNELVDDNHPISLILISTLQSQYFKLNNAILVDPIEVFFPCYTSQELIAILRERVPEGFDQDFYENFIKLALSVFHQLTNDLSELDYFCQSTFKKYIEPILTCGVSQADSFKLWRKFEPYVRGSLDQFALKTVNNSKVSAELPFSSKFLLISAYLASYNSTKSDKRFFLKNQGKLKTSRRCKLSTADKKLTGPKPFTFERLYHIFKSLMELNGDVGLNEIHLLEPTVLLLSQLQTLVSLNLLCEVRSTTTSLLSSLTKFRVADFVTSDYMMDVCKSVNFDLMAHLERFAAKS